MGWIVYENNSGRIHRWCKKASTARMLVTKRRNWVHLVYKDAESYYNLKDMEYSCCSYRDYEGILMGLRDDAFKLWQFCNTEPTKQE